MKWKRSLEFDPMSLMLGVPSRYIIISANNTSYYISEEKKLIGSVKRLVQLMGGIMLFLNF